MQADAISPGQTVVVIDDVIATGACYLNLTNATRRGFFDSALSSFLLLQISRALKVDQLQLQVNSSRSRAVNYCSISLSPRSPFLEASLNSRPQFTLLSNSTSSRF